MEWLQWHGGECPCAGVSGIALRFRGGSEMNTDRPHIEDWDHIGTEDDIVAWRMSDD